MAFWTFNQNNSGGSFDFDKVAGITHYVIIEASSREDAISRAEGIGIYFDGCADGRDCSCCGDRWHEPWEQDGSEFPEVYGENIRETRAVESFTGGWMEDGHEVAIHTLNGPVEWFGAVKKSFAS